MSTYPIATHSVEFSDDYSTLNVTCDGETIDSFSLQEVDSVKILITGGDYEIEYQNNTESGPHFTQSFDLEDFSEEGFKINADGGIGVVVIRDTFKTYQYHLDQCFILIQLEGSATLLVHSPCAPPCAAPDSICRTITFQE